MLGARVSRPKAESFRKEITRARLLDKKHFITDEGRDVLIPLTGRPNAALLAKHDAKLIDFSFRDRSWRVDPVEKIRSICGIPEDLKASLPDKWEQFGDVAVIRLEHSLDDYEREVAEAYAEVLALKAVIRDTGGVAGELREPVTRVLLGKDTVTTHLENGIRYRFDASKIMFSSGNVEERLRMADIPCKGETVVDMFAGIGYFSLPLAVYQKPKRIVACELNPVAHSFLVENVSLNGVSEQVEPVLGDNRDLGGSRIADRVIMGYVKKTHEFLPTALRLLKSGGILHYHETCPNELLPTRPIQRLVSAAKGHRVEIVRFKEIKSYAPGVTHVVVDARITRLS
ncbi:MAG TPA: class I SAM-dependent methyltransferase family protein [Thermoplasmata archaeon]